MAGTKQARVGIQDAMELMPRGRVVYEAVRDYVTSPSPEVTVKDPTHAINILGRVASEHKTMEPELPNEVVDTIGDFVGEYYGYSEAGVEAICTGERFRLDAVANKLVSVVFEYGYAAPRPAGVYAGY